MTTELYRNELNTVIVTLPSTATSISVQLIKDGITSSLSGVVWNSIDSTASIDLAFSLTSLDQEFDLKFNFTVGSESASIIEHVIVVTPVISRAKAELIAPGKYDDIESIVRHIIESYTGQCFGKWTGTYNIYGEDDAELSLPRPLLSLSGLSYGSVVESIDTYIIKGDRWWLAKDSFGLTVRQAPPEESFEYSIPGGETIFYPFRGTSSFGENAEFAVSGIWGYETVPVDVLKAAMILFNDYICNEATYRNRYVQQVAAQDWKLTFSGRTWDGTGNVLADQLLEKYRRTGMMII